MTWAKMQLSVAKHLIKKRTDFIFVEETGCSTTTACYLCECCVSYMHACSCPCLCTCMQRPEMSIGVFLLFSDRLADQQALGICIPLSHNNRAIGMGDRAHAWLFYIGPRYLNSISLV